MNTTRMNGLRGLAARLACTSVLSLWAASASAQDVAADAPAFPLDEDGEVRVLGFPGSATVVVAEVAWHGGCLLGNAMLLVLTESGSTALLDSPALVRSTDGAHLYRVALTDPTTLEEGAAAQRAPDAFGPLAFEDDLTGAPRVGELMRLDLATLALESAAIPAGGSLVATGGTVYTAPGTCAAPGDPVWRPLDAVTGAWGEPAPLPGEWPGPGLFGDRADASIELRYSAEVSSFGESGPIWPPDGPHGPWRLHVRVDDEGSRELVLGRE
jgi:hypothetical protein